MDDREEYLTTAVPIGTTAGSLYSPATGEQVYLTRIWIANTDTGVQQYSLYFDNDGTSYTTSTAIASLVTLDAGAGEYVDINIPMKNSAGNFGVKSSKGSAFTFTLFGIKL